jgi:hypothetical protein
MWSEIKDWYSQAARDSCGRFTFKSYVRKDFWTEELMAKKAECLELNQTLVDLINSRRPIGIRMAAQTRLYQALAQFLEIGLNQGLDDVDNTVIRHRLCVLHNRERHGYSVNAL